VTGGGKKWKKEKSQRGSTGTNQGGAKKKGVKAREKGGGGSRTESRRGECGKTWNMRSGKAREAVVRKRKGKKKEKRSR